jgi:carboxyl-terminal processing protease
MKKITITSILFYLLLIPLSCTDSDDQPLPNKLGIKDFIWRGMNTYYLWQADVPVLADSMNDNQSSYRAFLESTSEPINFFNALKVNETTDRFSRIYSDYTVLEGFLSGNTKNNGMDYGLKYKNGSTTDIYGWVRYVLSGSDAVTKNVQRGMIFNAINGTLLTVDNYKTLLANETYTINLADYDSGNITSNGQSITLTASTLAENPIFLNTVINEGSHNIGYLMYNGFYSNFDTQLNEAFGNLASQNITELVLDLRYNSGGAVSSAVKLASMITGQFTGQLFAKEQWNPKAQAYYEENSPSSLNNNFVSGLNSLNLTKVYILTSKGTASASELVINCLKPYINVVQIGDVTVGKNVASVTLYDSFDFSKNNINTTHTYAMQPIVLKTINKDGFGEYTAGLTPNYPFIENLATNIGVLGDRNEPMLNAAINRIIGGGRISNQSADSTTRDISDAKSLNPIRNEMYVERR